MIIYESLASDGFEADVQELLRTSILMRWCSPSYIKQSAAAPWAMLDAILNEWA